MNENKEREAAPPAPEPDQAEPPVPGSRRALTDVPSLQALAHPTRLALLEAIGLSGAMTATQASAVVGESPTACAYHLRMLARLGFIEEAGGGRGRERPWRLIPTGFSIDGDPDDPASVKAAASLTAALRERMFKSIRDFSLKESAYPQDVRDVTDFVQSVVFATPAELAELREELIALLSRYVDRIDPARRPAGSYPFEIVAFTHVLNLPALTGDPDAHPVPPP
jgi:DNA-binding transcriptional ArsR family regulator